MKTERYFILWCPYHPEGYPEPESEKVIAELDDLTAEEAELVAKAMEAGEASPHPEGEADVKVWCESESESRGNMVWHLLRRRQADAVREALSNPDTDYDQRHYRLASYAVWYAEELRRLRPQEATVQAQRRFEVYDTETGKALVFDEKDTIQHWGPVVEFEFLSGSAMRAYDDCPDVEVTMDLYRYHSGQWTLLTERTYPEFGPIGLNMPEATRLSDTEAAKWLVQNRFEIPEDVSQLAEEAFYTPDPPATKNDTVPDCDEPAKPRWDTEHRELSFGGKLCKKFRQPAENQTRLLDAFEESGWPTSIDDPIPPSRSGDQRQRLADTVRGLNKNSNGMIRFELDGTGESVIWKPKPENDDGDAPASEIPF